MQGHLAFGLCLLSTLFSCVLGPDFYEEFFFFLLLLPFFFPPDVCDFLDVVDFTALNFEVWEGGFIGLIVWID